METFQINSLFTDHMVIQRNKRVRVFGRGGNIGESVRVVFDDKSYESVIESEEWEVWLDAMDACSKGKKLTVYYRNEEYRFVDVVVGEVWLCGGQSNMQITIQYIYNKEPNIQVEYCQYDNWQNVRYYERPYHADTQICTAPNMVTQWHTVESFDQSRDFSATSMAFALNLAKMLENTVPVGIVNCAVSGSPIESWLSADAMSKLPSFYPDLNSVHYNGMLCDISGYTYGGFFWYQGCANAQSHMVPAYRKQFETLIYELRLATKVAELPAIVMQLVQFEDFCSWTSIRQVQWDLMELPYVYTVCGIDLGVNVTPNRVAVELDGVHPADKWIVGKRAAGVVADKVLKMLPVSNDMPFGVSPSIESAIWQDELIFLSVNGANLLTLSQGELGGFEVLVDSCWIPVNANLKGKKIVLSVNHLKGKPEKIRYLQSNVFSNELSFVYNEYQLPLAPLKEMTILI